jgi:hypothetical protein
MKRFSFFIPTVTSAIGMLIAFSSFSMGKKVKTSSNIQGYVKANPMGTVCNSSLLCNDLGGQICSIGSTQIWGKDTMGNCVVELYRNR